MPCREQGRRNTITIRVQGRDEIHPRTLGAVTTPPKLVALDIDGTLLDTVGSVSPAVCEAVIAATARAHVVLATGRTALGIEGVLRQLGMPALPAVCSNGAVIRHPDGELAIRTAFDPEPVVRMLEDVLPGAMFAAETPGTGHLVDGRFGERELAGQLRHVDTAELVATKTPRLIAKWPHRPKHDIAEVLATLTLPGTVATLDYTGNAWLTCVPAGTSKAVALEELRALLGVPPGETAAIGDGVNDTEMLTWAGCGVAMGQAPAIVQQAADMVTAPVGQDGVAKALRAWFG